MVWILFEVTVQFHEAHHCWQSRHEWVGTFCSLQSVCITAMAISPSCLTQRERSLAFGEKLPKASINWTLKDCLHVTPKKHSLCCRGCKQLTSHGGAPKVLWLTLPELAKEDGRSSCRSKTAWGQGWRWCLPSGCPEDLGQGLWADDLALIWVTRLVVA